jgi:hypothetical protein
MVESDEERRLRKRLAAVAHVEKSDDYALCRAAGISVAMCHDPRDPSVSKRSWERAVQDWRFGLRVGVWLWHRRCLLSNLALRFPARKC